MSKFAVVSFVLMSLFFCGCTVVHRNAVAAPATEPAAGETVLSEAQNSKVVQFPHVQTFETTLSPAATIDVIAKLFGELKFNTGYSANGMYSPNGTADHFSGIIGARTLENRTLKIKCKWVAEDRTHVVFSSDLDDAENAFVVKCIRGVLGNAATTP